MQSLVAVAIVIGILVVAENRASAGQADKNYHEICEQSGPTNSIGTTCIPFGNFVQRRDRCTGERPDPCFGVVKTSDGFSTGLIQQGRCGVFSKPCEAMPFRFATLEYRTDVGDEAKRWQSRQRDAIIEDISSDPKVFLVVFVHGWRHSARESPGKEYPPYVEDPDNIDQDRNLRYFKHLLAKTRWELNRAGRADQRVLGIYVGWNGGPETTFSAVLALGGRAQAADRLGKSSDLASDLEAISEKLIKAHSSNRMLLIGHSFGGRIVSRFMMKAIREKREWAPLGEHALAVTINPAISADSFTELMKEKPSTRLPTWINFTSEDDDATRDMFPTASSPLARIIGVGRGLNDTILNDATGATVGHYRPFQTHRLRICHFGGKKEKDSEVCKELKSKVASECGSVPSPSSRGKSDWYKIEPGRLNSCRYFCASFEDNSLKCGSEKYLSVLDISDHGVQRATAPGRMWNVITGKDVIGPDEPFTKAGSIDHNAFVQTNLTRLVVEMLLNR